MRKLFVAELNRELIGHEVEAWTGTTISGSPSKLAKDTRYRMIQRWRDEAKAVRQVPATFKSPLSHTPSSEHPVRNIVVRHHLCPGDSLVLTAAVESLARQFPGRFRIATDTNCPEVWLHNPHVVPFDPALTWEAVEVGYDLIHRSDVLPIHFIGAFCSDLGERLGIPLVPQINRPVLYLTDDECKPISELPRPYALLNAGTKDDYTAKFAGRQIYQEIVDHFAGRITFVQVGLRGHHHPQIDGAIDLIGRTSPRALFSLAFNAAFGVGGVTFLGHIYAALQRPYVCYSGGREPLNWITYPTQTTLSTHGQLECCRTRGCWKARTIALNDHSPKDQRLCSLPTVDSYGENVPGCLAMLGSRAGIEAIERIIGNEQPPDEADVAGG